METNEYMTMFAWARQAAGKQYHYLSAIGFETGEMFAPFSAWYEAWNAYETARVEFIER